MLEHNLPKCVEEVGTDEETGIWTMVSMPLEDLRFAYGYMALVEAGTEVTAEQTARACHISIRLSHTRRLPDDEERP
jgi:hypothetical protein